ncbi:hypothetical protein F5I97DRAFT_1926703 [Phlebopus sp. FC_14]|nr:hypothetical protein F5I97DRAFT_1926703 [Phlebopus sp. FC_14]
MYLSQPRHHYGYLINVEKTVQLILIHDPHLRKSAAGVDVGDCVDAFLSRAVHWVARQFPLLGIYTAYVWFGAGQRSLCWAFPPTMQPRTRTQEQARQLAKFKKLVELGGEPVMLASEDLPEPESYKTMDPPQFLIEWSLLAFITRCDNGEITLETLLAPLRDLSDMRNLSLAERVQGSESHESQATATISHQG